MNNYAHYRAVKQASESMLRYRNSVPKEPGDGLHHDDARRLADLLLGLASNLVVGAELSKKEQACASIRRARKHIKG